MKSPDPRETALLCVRYALDKKAYDLLLLDVSACTSLAARIIRQEGRIGRIAPGLRADLAAFEGDPSVRIEDLQRPVLSMKDGALHREPGEAAPERPVR